MVGAFALGPANVGVDLQQRQLMVLCVSEAAVPVSPHKWAICAQLPTAKPSPLSHQLSSLFESAAPPIGALDRRCDCVGESHLDLFPAELGLFTGPVPEGRAKAVHGDVVMPHSLEQLGQGHVG